MHDIAKYQRLTESVNPGAIESDPEAAARLAASGKAVEPGIAPSMIIRPSDEAELQKLIRLANAEDLNLTVTSSAPPHRKGGLAAVSENWLVDLSAWKGIPWINRRNRVALIQPGVTYPELLNALEAQGMTISMPLAPRSGKSVLASVMDREPTTWANKQWDIGDPAASTEFIFGNGELFRTGAAGGPGSLEDQRKAGGAQKSSAGPSQTDFHRVVGGSQGTMGVLTWISVRTELKPSIEKPYVLGADQADRLIPFMYEVQRPWLGEQSFILNRAALAMLLEAQGMGAAKGAPAYVCLQNIAGFERLPQERVAYQEEDINKIALKHGLEMKEHLGILKAKNLLRAAATPCGKTDWRCGRKGDCLSLFFLTTLDKAPHFEALFMPLAEKHGFVGSSVGMYVQPVVQNHGCHVEFLAPFDPGDKVQVASARALDREAVSVLADAGAFFSRPYGAAGQAAFSRNALNFKILQKVKAIFDPHRVLNRGKWGL